MVTGLCNGGSYAGVIIMAFNGLFRCGIFGVIFLHV